ncbi:hypothetical protein ACJIZ3_013626 [Penstemon smallii]|uniref:E3 ubiquitin-protein ligase PRT1 n=1 Tax=Penstemon smallii TaxID=265156 RepID=A0ABD3RH92_9LAMI
MENRSSDKGDMDGEDFPDEFQCCVCLDIMYKPVVLACGHISCFWCVFKAMDTWQESHCPVCRNPYNHFPRICTLMHFLLLKLYPSAYKRREKQVAEEEKGYGHASPQFEDNLLKSQSSEVLDVRDPSPLPKAVPLNSNNTCSGDTFPGEDNITTTNDTNSTVEYKDTNGNCREVLLTDLQCAVCKQLLCRPLVLNCGHVYCEACINNPQDSVCKCPVCQSSHPNGFPNVCLVLEHFLEEHFPEEYSARKESLANIQRGTPSGSSIEKQDQTACSSDLRNVHSSSRSDLGQVHFGVGCDYCGMCPIIGKRYKCKDCVEQIGFDLCEECHNSSSKLPGRFNQQHTQDHQFSEEPPPCLRNLILSLEADYSEDHELSIVDSDNPEVVLRVPDLSNDVSEDERETVASPDSADEDAVFSAALSNNLSEDQGR